MGNGPYVWSALVIWGAWGISWLAAGLWTSRRTAVAIPSSYRGHLLTAFVGYGLLFFGRPVSAHALWIASPVIGWTMVALVALCCVFAWWARLNLGSLWSAGITRREGHRVVDSGPYALVRHPIYTAIIGGAVALAAVKATPVAMLGAVLIAIGFSLKAKVEERFLAHELGEGAYGDYRRRVPMLVPFLHARH